MNKINFLKESIKNLKTTGTITRSSKFLCKAMIRHINFDTAKIIVELGPGDGVITEFILEHMRPDAMLLVFEVNEVFCELLKEKIHDTRFHLIEDSAEYIEKYLMQLDKNCKADYVISGIPFVMLPDDLAKSIVIECKKILKKDALFVQFHYSLLLKKLYQDVFGNVDIHFVPLNFPPAFVMVSKKE